MTTNPAGAEVFDGGRLVGVAPIVVKLPRDGEPHTIAVKKDGYLTAQRVVDGKQNRALELRLMPKPPEEKEEPLPPPPAAAPLPLVASAQPPHRRALEPPRAQKPRQRRARAERRSPRHTTPAPKKEDTLILTPSF